MEELVTSLATQLHTLSAQQSGQVHAVSLKLPDFWTSSSEVWFARVEAQFGTKGITLDQTKDNYVVSALDASTADEIQSVLINPPTANKYVTLKTALIKSFGKSQLQRDNEILNLHGLGDKRPTALLRKINSLNNDPRTLKHALFLMNLPPDIRSILAGHEFKDTDALAEAADRIWETRNVGTPHVSPAGTFAVQPTDLSAAVDAVSTARVSSRPGSIRRSTFFSRPSSSATTNSFVCFYHLRFGTDARRCKPGCKYACLPRPLGDLDPSVSGNAPASR